MWEIKIERNDEITDEEYNSMWEDEIIEWTYEEYKEENTEPEEWNIWIQQTYTYYCDIYIWQNCRYRIWRPRGYNFQLQNPWIAYHNMGRDHLYIEWKQAGNATYYLRWRYQNYKIHVNVKAPPKPIEYNITVEEWKQSNIYLPLINNYWINIYWHRIQYLNQWRVSLHNLNGWSIWIKWTVPGNIKYYIKVWGLDKYLLNITITPTPPQIVDIDLYETKEAKHYLLYSNTYTYTFSEAWKVDTIINPHNISFTVKTPWEVEVYVKKNGIHRYTFHIKVSAIPEPIEYNISVEKWKNVDIYLPESDRAWYGYRAEHMDNGRSGLYNYSWWVKLRWYREWTLKYYVLWKYSINRYIFNVTIIPEPPKIIEIEAYEGQEIKSRMYRADLHDFSFSETGKIDVKTAPYDIYITGKELWELQVYAHKNWIHTYTLNVKILPLPEPIEYDISVGENKYVEIYFPENNNSSYQVKYNDDGKVAFYWYSWKVKLKWLIGWNLQYYVYDAKGVNRYILNVKVIPKPPMVSGASVFETRTTSFGFPLAHLYQYSVSETDMVKLSTSTDRIYVKWLKPWTVEIYGKFQWKHLRTFKVTVQEKPKPIEYNVNLHPSWSTVLYLPSEVHQYDYSVENHTLLRDWKVSIYWNRFRIEANRAWKVILHFKEKNGHRFDKYRVNINITVPEIYHTFYISERINALFYKYDHRLYDQSIIRINGGKYIHGLKPGTTTINSYSNSILRKIHHITVLPIPEPQHIYTTTEVWKRVVFRWAYKRWYRYTQSRGWVVQIDASNNAMKVNAQATGTATVYITSEKWWYITHVYHIQVNPKPVKQYSCEVPQWIECETYLYPEDEWYTYAVTTPGIVQLNNKRHYYAALNERYSLLHIEWQKEWATNIYIYKNGDHHATIQTKILPEIPPIRVSIEGDIKEWETKETKVISWWGKYKIIEESENISVSVKEDGSELTITWKNPWEWYFTIKDQYNQTAKYWIKIRDVSLMLTRYDITLNRWQEEELYIHEYYKWIKPLKKSNDNIKVWIETDKNNEKYLLIKWEKQWETIVQIEDAQWNIKMVRVTVGAWTTQPPVEWWEEETPVTNPNDMLDPFTLIDDLLKQVENENSANGIEVNSVDTEDGISIANGALYERYNSAVLWLRETEEGRKYMSSLNKILNGIKSWELEKKDIFLERIEIIEAANKNSKNKNLWYVFDMLISGIQSDIEDYWTHHPEERQEYVDALVKWYLDLWLDITWLKSTWEWLGTVAAYWTAQITNDPYLEQLAKENLNADLKLIALELNPIRKWKKLKQFAKGVKYAKNLSNSQIDKLIRKWWSKVPKSVIRIDKDVVINWKNIDPAHIHIKRDWWEIAIYKKWKMKHEKGNISLNSKELEFLKWVGWIE